MLVVFICYLLFSKHLVMTEWWGRDAGNGRRDALQEGLAPGVRQYERKVNAFGVNFKKKKIKKS